MKIGKLEVKREDLALRHHIPFEMKPFPEKEGLKTMRRGCVVLTKTQADFWISSGNLLGLYRDKRLIPHDTDIDVNVLMTWDTLETNQRSKQILFGMLASKFRVIRSVIYQNHFMQLAFIDRNGVIFDIYFFYKRILPLFAVNLSREGIIRKPLKFVNKLGNLRFKGVDYPIPNKIEEFLVWRYGDWKTPAKKKIPWQEERPNLDQWT